MRKKAELNQKLVDAVLAILLWWICFTLFSAMRRSLYFMDEMDNFAIGVQVAKGSVVYRDVFSQHMPLMYYICAIMAKLGVHTVVGFRLAWYGLLSTLYAVIFWRYRKDFGRVPLLLWPVFYLMAISTKELCFAILAEQLQAVSAVLLALEFLRFYRTREVPWHGAVVIAVSINIAFLSAFMALFGCAVIVAAYIVLEVIDCIKAKRKLGEAIVYLWKKYWLTILLTLLPVMLLCAYYSMIGALDYLLYFTFTFNTEIYSKYIGVGESPVRTILMSFYGWICACKDALQVFLGRSHQLPIAAAVLMLGENIYLLWMAWKRRWGQAAVLLLFFILCGVRGFFNYHSLHTFSLSALLAALLLGQVWKSARNFRIEKGENDKKRIALKGFQYIFVLASVALVFYTNDGYFWDRRNDLYPTKKEFTPQYSLLSNEGLLSKFAQPGEYILQNINAEHLYVSNDVRIAPYNTGMSPWWWEGSKERSMKLLQEDPPRFAIFDPEYTVFEKYTVKNFAPELTEFVQKNYQLLQGAGDYFWVRNDCVKEISRQLKETVEFIPCGEKIVPDFISSDTVIEQHFVAERSQLQEISIRFVTFGALYDGTVEVSFVEESNGKELAAWHLNGYDVPDNIRMVIYQSCFSDPITLKPGKEYRLTIQPHSPTKAFTFSLWMRQAPEEDGQAFINEEQQPYNYDIIIL